MGIFMFAAGTFASLLEHPGCPIPEILPDSILERLLMGVAIGLTAIALIYSPWGQPSGAHLNALVILVFSHLGKIKPWDTRVYIMVQFFSAMLEVWRALAVLGDTVAHPSVNYVVTIPGGAGFLSAFLVELGISFIRSACSRPPSYIAGSMEPRQ